MRVPVYHLLFLILSSVALPLEAGTPQAFTIADFLAVVRKSDPGFEKILLTRLRLEYQDALLTDPDSFDVQLQANYGEVLQDGERFNGGSIDVNKTWTGSGTSVGAAVERNENLGVLTETWSATITQALGKNAFGNRTGIQEKQAALESTLLKTRMLEEYENRLAELIHLWLDWVLARENLRLARVALEDARLLEARAKKRFRQRVAIDIDVRRARLQTLQKEESRISRNRQYETILKNIRLYGDFSGDAIPAASTRLPYSRIVPDPAAAGADDRQSKIARLQEQILELKRDLREENLRSDMALSLGYNYRKSGRFTTPGRRELILGFNWLLPLEQKREVALLHQAEIDLESARVERRMVRQERQARLNRILVELEHTRQLIANSGKMVTLARQVWQGQKQRYERGIVDITEVTDSKNHLDQQVVNNLGHRIRLNKSAVDWLNASDQLLRELAPTELTP